MAELTLKTVTRTQGNNRALKDGTVKPKTFAFDFVEVDPLIAAFRRMVPATSSTFARWRSLPTYAPGPTVSRYRGAGLPGARVSSRRYYLQPQSRHPPPKDLEGRKVGVNRGYTVTTGVWAAASYRKNTASTSARSPGFFPATSMWPNTARPRTSCRSSRERTWATCSLPASSPPPSASKSITRRQAAHTECTGGRAYGAAERGHYPSTNGGDQGRTARGPPRSRRGRLPRPSGSMSRA